MRRVRVQGPRGRSAAQNSRRVRVPQAIRVQGRGGAASATRTIRAATGPSRLDSPNFRTTSRERAEETIRAATGPSRRDSPNIRTTSRGVNATPAGALDYLYSAMRWPCLLFIELALANRTALLIASHPQTSFNVQNVEQLIMNVLSLRGHSAEESRRRRGCHVDIPRRRGYSVRSRPKSSQSRLAKG